MVIARFFGDARGDNRGGFALVRPAMESLGDVMRIKPPLLTINSKGRISLCSSSIRYSMKLRKHVAFLDQ